LRIFFVFLVSFREHDLTRYWLAPVSKIIVLSQSFFPPPTHEFLFLFLPNSCSWRQNVATFFRRFTPSFLFVAVPLVLFSIFASVLVVPGVFLGLFRPQKFPPPLFFRLTFGFLWLFLCLALFFFSSPFRGLTCYGIFVVFFSRISFSFTLFSFVFPTDRGYLCLPRGFFCSFLF